MTCAAAALTAALVQLWLGPVLPSAVAAEIARLEGHKVTVSGNGASYTIDDIAGEGPPVVGIVERERGALVLRTDLATFELRGPLARPRIAGPGYKVWVVGEVTGDRVLLVRRLGVLAPPWAQAGEQPARHRSQAVRSGDDPQTRSAP